MYKCKNIFMLINKLICQVELGYLELHLGFKSWPKALSSSYLTEPNPNLIGG